MNPHPHTLFVAASRDTVAIFYSPVGNLLFRDWKPFQFVIALVLVHFLHVRIGHGACAETTNQTTIQNSIPAFNSQMSSA